MNQTVIKIENLYKEYRLGSIGYATLREYFQRVIAEIQGKPDPNSIIVFLPLMYFFIHENLLFNR